MNQFLLIRCMADGYGLDVNSLCTIHNYLQNCCNLCVYLLY